MKSFFINAADKAEKINSAVKCRGAILTALIICIIAVSLGVPLIKGSDSFSAVVSAGAFFSVIAVLMLIRRDSIERFSVKKTYGIPIVLTGLLFLFNGLLYSVAGYIAVGIVFCIIIPFLNLVFYSHSQAAVCRAISRAIMISFIAFILICILMGAPIGKTQYTGILSNPNTLGNFMIIAVAANIYLICDAYRSRSMHKKNEQDDCSDNGQSKSRRENRNICFLYIPLALAVVVAVYSNSRTSMIAIFMQLAVVFLMYLIRKIRCHDAGGCVRLAKRALAFLILAFVLFFAMFFVLTDVKVQIIKALPDIQITNEYDNVKLSGMLGRMGARYTKGLDNSESSGDDDQFTSGRKEIWKDYINNIGVLGHEKEGRDIKEELRTYHGANAHNVYLQMAYSAGIPAGLAMIALMFFTAKDLIKKMYAFIRDGLMDEGLVLTICCALGFAIVSLTSGGYMLYTYLPSTFFYFSLFTLSIKDKSIRE